MLINATIVSSFIDNIIYFVTVFDILSLQPSSVTVQPGVCMTLSETPDRFFGDGAQMSVYLHV